MARLNKANVAWFGLLPKVAQIIRHDWQPGNLTSEPKCRDSLAAFLRESGGPDAHVETEYRHAGTTTDVYLKWHGIFSSGEVFIELKLNLQQKDEYDRLIGQIVQINPAKHNLIVLLIGEHNENFVARLRERYKMYDVPYPSSPRIVIKKGEETTG